MRCTKLRLTSFLKRFRADKRGATILIFALSLPIMIGFLGLGSEVGYWYVNQRNMQTAADFGAYTAAVELRGLSSEAVAVTAGKEEANNNGGDDATIDAFTVNIPPTSGSVLTGDAAEFIIVRTLPRLFSSLFISTPMSISVRAVAQFSEGGPACILALNPGEARALDVTGTADITLTTCDVQSNSIHAEGARVAGNAELETGCFSSSGGYSVTDGLTLTDCTDPQPGAPIANDPYASLPTPDYTPGDCLPDPGSSPGNNVTIPAGHYCGLKIQGEATMEPGLYIIEGGGGFTTTASADLTAIGVTIFMTEDASPGGPATTVTMNGSAEVNMSAPTSLNSTVLSEPYEGVLFYADRTSDDESNKINGNSFSRFEGAFYFPTQAVEFTGNNAAGPGCMFLVADTVSILGNASFGNDCTTDDYENGPKSAGYVRLVE